MFINKKKVEIKCISGSPRNVVSSLKLTIGQFKRYYKDVKVGITGRNPQLRFNEHLQNKNWKRMVVIYKTSSENFANTIEEWLVDRHYYDLYNYRKGGGSDLHPCGNHYVYVLLDKKINK
jgi:hypothetical protein